MLRCDEGVDGGRQLAGDAGGCLGHRTRVRGLALLEFHGQRPGDGGSGLGGGVEGEVRESGDEALAGRFAATPGSLSERIPTR